MSDLEKPTYLSGVCFRRSEAKKALADEILLILNEAQRPLSFSLIRSRMLSEPDCRYVAASLQMLLDFHYIEMDGNRFRSKK